MSSNHIFARALRMAKLEASADGSTGSNAPQRFVQPKIDPLVFVSLGSEKTGVASSARPVLQGIQRLTAGQSLKVIFKLPGFDGWIKATAKVVWLGRSADSAGLRFVDIPGESGRLVDDWVSTREQAGQPGSAPGSPTPASNVAGLPDSREFQVDRYQIVLPVEAIEVIPGHRSYRLVLTQAGAPSIAPSNAARVEAKPEKSVAAPQFLQTSTSLPTPVRFGVAQEGAKKQARATQPFSLALAALVGMFVVAGVILWHSQGELSARLINAEPVQPEARVEAAALPEMPIDASQNSVEVPQSESAAPTLANPALSAINPQSGAKPEKPKQLALPVAPRQLARTTGHSEASQQGPTQQIVRKTPSSVPISPAANSRPAAATSATAPLAKPATMPARSISERAPEPTVAAVAEKVSSPAAAETLNAESATGSIEIVSDPYPSIRAPADASARGSRPVALTIGHLVSKVDPAYPSEALRQRISGTVKLHLVRGLDGRVESASVIDGPAPLREAALHAVEQWQYEPTLLGSAPVQAEEDVAVVFRIITPSH